MALTTLTVILQQTGLVSYPGHRKKDLVLEWQVIKFQVLLEKNKGDFFHSRQRPVKSSRTVLWKSKPSTVFFLNMFTAMLSNKNPNSSLKSLSSSCSWYKGWVKRPGRCRVCHLRGEWNERPNTEPDSHPKRLWPQQPTTPSYILGHQHQTSFSQKVLTTEDLSPQDLEFLLRWLLRVYYPHLFLQGMHLTECCPSPVVIYPSSAWMFSGIKLLHAVLFSADLVLRHYLLWTETVRNCPQIRLNNQPFIVRQCWYHPWSDQGLKIK